MIYFLLFYLGFSCKAFLAPCVGKCRVIHYPKNDEGPDESDSDDDSEDEEAATAAVATGQRLEPNLVAKSEQRKFNYSRPIQQNQKFNKGKKNWLGARGPRRAERRMYKSKCKK